MKDSVFSIKNSLKIADIEKTYEQENQRKIDTIKERFNRKVRIYYTIGIGLLLLVVIAVGWSYYTQKNLNKTIIRLVNEQEQTIRERTKELAVSNEKLLESNEKLAEYNRKLIELMQFNAHNLREPLTRIMGAMVIQEYISTEEFFEDIWPQMRKATTDLDTIIREVITRADEAVENQ